jgi:hypothetical protein
MTPRSLVTLLALVLVAALPAAAHADGRKTPPKVPACFSQAGICDGMPLKSAFGPTKLTSGAKNGVFDLTGPSPLQFTEHVACGDAGCIFNHLDWHVGSEGAVKKGCEVNTTTCSVAVNPGGPAWTPVLVTQNDFPVAFWLLWEPDGGEHTISGKITASDCGDDDKCSLKPLPGVAVSAKGAGSGSATTGADGSYSMSVPKGDYSVTAKLDGATFAPASRDVGVHSGDVKGVDFRAKSACEEAAGASARAAGDDNPCQRLYTIKVGAWLPYTTVADPFTGATNFDGTGDSQNAKSLLATATLGYLASDAYPPCLGEQVLKTYAETRPEMTWSSRFLGSGTGTPPANGGMGTVTVPIAWNGKKHQATIRSPSVTGGTLQRQYDFTYTDSGARGSCRQPVARTVTPTVRTSLLGNDKFVIELSWPIPFQPFEDLGDVKSFTGATVGQANAAFVKRFDAELNGIPGYKDLPAAVKSKMRAYLLKFAEKAGGEAAISLGKEALKNVSGFLTAKTPPPITYGKKALDILKKASYGSADVRIVGTFATKEGIGRILAGQTRLQVTADTDAFPSFSLAITRGGQQIPWDGNQSATVTKTGFSDPYGALPDVINDASTETGAQVILQGGPAVHDQILNGLDSLRNTTPALLRAFLPPLLIGNPGGEKTLTWTFPGGRS